MTTASTTGHVRQALRDATMEDHRQVDSVFSAYDLHSRADYTAFLTAQARALGALEAVARPESPRLPLLAQDLAALGRRIGKILGRAPGQTLSIADVKAIRAAARREYSAAHLPAALCLTPRPPHTPVWLDAQPSSGVTRL